MGCGLSTLPDGVGPAPEVIYCLAAEIAHGCAAQTLSLGFGQVVQVVLSGGIQNMVGHGVLRVGEGWFELY
ncbi:hypothetical protein MIZ03_4555 [Rhodoferax lithotrophicus]|uniref:Uncharacterized protein n=1 Tax=Rhodoferax lithotrophicus TaxID=2798804 RepID=A0ABN6DC99_9BURK|nr:hypothetical protein MIZ03_4555 [Rhodoferax sp. MIZ03]